MKMIETLKHDQEQARKEKNKFQASVLTVMYDQALKVGKNDGNRETTDQEVLKEIKSAIKVASGNVELYTKTGQIEKAQEAKGEIDILSRYLPQMSSEQDIQKAIDELVSNGLKPEAQNMNQFMKSLKEKFGDSLDGKTASLLVKKTLST